MSATIVGISAKAGVYEGNPFDNIYFHVTEPFEQGKGFGSQSKTHKVKRKTLTEIFGKELTDKDLAAFINQAVEFYFNEHQTVKYIEIQQPPK